MYKTNYGSFNGDSWEAFCQMCFKHKYEKEGYQEMPAWQGDLGIEGFTRSGILFQCYCPDAEYNPDKLYEEQRDKITADLKKLSTYKKELKTYLGDVKVSKWIFVTPEYKNKDLVRHCQNKAVEVKKWELPFLSKDFDVLINDIEFFSEQIPIINAMTNQKIDIDPKEKKTPEQIADWKTKEIDLSDNAIRKHDQRVPENAKNRDGKVNKLAQQSIGDFLNGDTMIRIWQEKYQDQYEKFQKVIDLFEQGVEEKCAVFDGNNNQLYDSIKVDLRRRLVESFNFLDDTMIDRLTNRVMADWVLRCPISFE